MAHYSANGIQPTNFDKGDIVLLRRAVDRAHKLSPRWTVPYRIVGIEGSLVFHVESMTSSKRARVHATRFLPYRVCKLNDELTPEEATEVNRSGM